MIYFCPLFSGSSGNSTFIGYGEGGIISYGLLIDCGKSSKAIADALMTQGLSLYHINSILITHSHIDHVSALKTLNKKIQAPVLASHDCLIAMEEEKHLDTTNRYEEIPQRFQLGPFFITSFSTSHDAPGSVGYILECEGTKIAYVTDLGIITDEIETLICGSKIVYLESNYDSNMLSVSRYPYALKQRIRGPEGHLSNEACSQELCKLVSNGSYYLYLAHLSQENNFPPLAETTALEALHRCNFRENIDFSLYVCNRSNPSPLIKI